jgi:hypothetical protein
MTGAAPASPGKVASPLAKWILSLAVQRDRAGVESRHCQILDLEPFGFQPLAN